jgi:hypothetical protein
VDDHGVLLQASIFPQRTVEFDREVASSSSWSKVVDSDFANGARRLPTRSKVHARPLGLPDDAR